MSGDCVMEEDGDAILKLKKNKKSESNLKLNKEEVTKKRGAFHDLFETTTVFGKFAKNWVTGGKTKARLLLLSQLSLLSVISDMLLASRRQFLLCFTSLILLLGFSSSVSVSQNDLKVVI